MNLYLYNNNILKIQANKMNDNQLTVGSTFTIIEFPFIGEPRKIFCMLTSSDKQLTTNPICTLHGSASYIKSDEPPIPSVVCCENENGIDVYVERMELIKGTESEVTAFFEFIADDLITRAKTETGAVFDNNELAQYNIYTKRIENWVPTSKNIRIAVRFEESSEWDRVIRPLKWMS